jgi:hypothetical protein
MEDWMPTEEKPELDAFRSEMESLERCCLKHPVDYKVGEIESVKYWVPSEPDGETGYALFRLKDGRWGAMEESQDYTGHGWQCGSSVEFYATEEEAIRLGIGENGCKVLLISMPVVWPDIVRTEDKVPMTLTAEAAMDVVHQASADCHQGPEVTFKEEDVEKVFYCDGGCNCGTLSEKTTCNTYCDTWSKAIFRLKDGRYVVSEESSDTTGHGWQCSGSVEVFDSKDSLLKLGCTEDEREEMDKLVS